LTTFLFYVSLIGSASILPLTLEGQQMQRITLQFVSIALFALSLQGQGSVQAESLRFYRSSARLELLGVVAEILELRPVLAKNPCDSVAASRLLYLFGSPVLDSIKVDLARACKNRGQPRFTRSRSELRKIEVVSNDSALLQSHESFGLFFWWSGTWHWTATRSTLDNRWRLQTISRRKPQGGLAR